MEIHKVLKHLLKERIESFVFVNIFCYLMHFISVVLGFIVLMVGDGHDVAGFINNYLIEYIGCVFTLYTLFDIWECAQLQHVEKFS